MSDHIKILRDMRERFGESPLFSEDREALDAAISSLRQVPEAVYFWRTRYESVVRALFIANGHAFDTAERMTADDMKERDKQYARKFNPAPPTSGERDRVMAQANFRAACYALVGIVDGAEGRGRRWAAGGERLKDTLEWVVFYNAVNALRNGEISLANPGDSDEQ